MKNIWYNIIKSEQFPSPYSWVGFVDETYVQHFYSSNQISLRIFGHFLKFLLICEFCLWQISPSPEYMSQKML